MYNSTGVTKMSKKNKNKGIEFSEETEKALTEAEEQKHLELQKAYDEYAERTYTRRGMNEQVETKPYEKWIRKAKKIDPHGNLIEIEVAGDTGETKNEKFRRLALSRMTKALTALDTIMNLSSNQYESTPEEQTKIVNVLRLKVLDIENSFKVQEKQESLFKFET